MHQTWMISVTWRGKCSKRWTLAIPIQLLWISAELVNCRSTYHCLKTWYSYIMILYTYRFKKQVFMNGTLQKNVLSDQKRHVIWAQKNICYMSYVYLYIYIFVAPLFLMNHSQRRFARFLSAVQKPSQGELPRHWRLWKQYSRRLFMHNRCSPYLVTRPT